MDFEAEYKNMCSEPSDIWEHLPVLSQLTSECNHVTEMGIRFGVSTRAFLRHDVKYIGYDVADHGMAEFLNRAKEAGRDTTFHLASTLEVEIEPTDLLFIDTAHNYAQLKKELELHADKAKKYLVFHDTTLFESHDESDSGPGLWPAVQEFLDTHPEWEIKERYTNNNGLTVLRRLS